MNVPPTIRLIAIFAALIVLLISLVRGFNEASRSEASRTASRQTATIPQFNPLPCSGAAGEDIHHERLDKDTFTVNIPKGCSSGGIFFPTWWNTWYKHLSGNTAGCTVYMRYEGENPRGPFNEDLLARTDWNTASRILHLEMATGQDGQNGCKMTFYTYNVHLR